MVTFVLFLSQRKIFQPFNTEYSVSCGFVIYGVYYVEVHSFCTQFVENFYQEGILYFVKYFVLRTQTANFPNHKCLHSPPDSGAQTAILPSQGAQPMAPFECRPQQAYTTTESDQWYHPLLSVAPLLWWPYPNRDHTQIETLVLSPPCPGILTVNLSRTPS